MKDIKNYEGLYAITSCGKVWGYKRKKFLKPQKDRYGYLKVGLYKDGKSKTFKVHRLVAETYIENPNNLDTVDHIDGNKEHNYMNNLQWMSHIDNSVKGHNKPIKCIETGQIFESNAIAAKEMGLDRGNISHVCNRKQKTTGGFHFEFI